MSTELASTLTISADASGVEAGVNTAKRSLASIGQSAAQAGKDGGDGLGKIGTGAETAAKRVDAATKAMVNSIQRQTAAVEAGDKSSRQYQESLARYRGVDVAVLKPYLDQLDAMKAKQLEAAGGLDKVGMSAKATAAALRGVPAQFTDIATSIQGGQAPLTVFLQQGGQLKDMFGGAGAAAKALGGYVLGLINPYTAAAGALAAVGYAAYSASQETRAFQSALLLSGNAAGVTVDQLRNIAVTSSASAVALAAFARAGDVSGDSLKNFAESAERFEKMTGIAVAESVKHFSELKKDPVSASIKLNEQVDYLTTSIYRQIKALEDQGKHIAAGALAQEEFRKAQARIADGIDANLSPVEAQWNAITKSINGAWKELKNFVAGDDIAKQIATSQGKLAEAKKGAEAAKNSVFPLALEQYQRIIAAEEKRLFILQSGLSLEKGVSKEKAEQIKSRDAQIAFDREHDKYLSKEVQMRKEINAAKELAKAAPQTPENAKALKDTLAGIRDKFKTPGQEGDPFAADRLAAKAWEKAMVDAYDAISKAAAKSDGLTENERKRREIASSEQLAAFDKLVPGSRDLALAAYDRAIADERSTAALKVQDDYINALAKTGNAETKRLADQVAKQIEHNAEIGKTKEQIDQNRAAMEAAATVELESQSKAIELLLEKNDLLVSYGDVLGLLEPQAKAIYELELKNLRDQVALRKQLAAGFADGAQREAAAQAAKESAAEWKRGWEETDRLARDVFTTWATDGSNAAQKIGDTLKKALLSAIYEATLKPLVFNMYSSLTGGGGGSAANTVSNAVNGASAFSKIGSATGLTAFGGSFSAGMSLGAEAFLPGVEMMTSATGVSSFMAGAGQAAGSAFAAAGPYVLAAIVANELMQYKVEAKGNSLTATVGSTGVTNGKVGTRADFQQTGGLFGGGTTMNSDWGVADQSVANYITANVQAITSANKAYADSIGLSASAVDGFTKNIEVNITGLDAAGQKAAIDAELAKFSAEQIAGAYGSALAAVAKDGETTATTLARLATDLSGVNSSFGALGYTLYDVSVAGAAAASGLSAAFGSLQNFQAQTQALYQNYYTQEEQRANTINSVVKNLDAAGITGFSAADVSGATREQVRAVVDQYAAKVGTATGDKQYAAVVAAANMLTGVVPAFVAAAAAPAPVVAAGGSGGGGGGSAGSAAASEIESAWKSITDSIWGEVKRIRGLLEGAGADAYTAAQAKFAIATAQARAGDQVAATALPELSQNLLALAETNAQTLLQLRLIQAQTANSLSTTGSILAGQYGLTVPSLDVGTNRVPQDMLAMVHRGEQIIPEAYNPALGGSSDGATVAALRSLADRLDLIEANTRAGAQHGGALSRQITRLVPDGDALEVRVIV